MLESKSSFLKSHGFAVRRTEHLEEEIRWYIITVQNSSDHLARYNDFNPSYSSGASTGVRRRLHTNRERSCQC